MVTSNSRPLVELEAEIVELEEEIPDLATRDGLLAIPKKLFTEAQDYIRTGNAREAPVRSASTPRKGTVRQRSLVAFGSGLPQTGFRPLATHRRAGPDVRRRLWCSMSEAMARTVV
jgi:hypothetical protein